MVTVNTFGEGKAWYVASSPDQPFLQGLLKVICAERQIVPLLDAAEEVEAALREKEGEAFLFLLNHSPQPQKVELAAGRKYDDLLTRTRVQHQVNLPPYGVAVLKAIE